MQSLGKDFDIANIAINFVQRFVIEETPTVPCSMEIVMYKLQCISPSHCLYFSPLVLPSTVPAQGLVDAFRGDQVSLRCNVMGDPSPSMVWLFHGEQLATGLHYRLLANGTLVIVSMTAAQGGEYVCVAENLMGRSNATVTVEYNGEGLRADSPLH